jgi:hypothetical protein
MPYERFKETIVDIESEWEGKNIQDLPYETLERYYHLRQMQRAYYPRYKETKDDPSS